MVRGAVMLIIRTITIMGTEVEEMAPGETIIKIATTITAENIVLKQVAQIATITII
jgi:hypothetical protein